MFNLFLTDQPHVHDLVTCSVVVPEACLSLTEFLLIVAQHSLVDAAQHYLAGMSDKCKCENKRKGTKWTARTIGT